MKILNKLKKIFISESIKYKIGDIVLFKTYKDSTPMGRLIGLSDLMEGKLQQISKMAIKINNIWFDKYIIIEKLEK